MSPVLREFKLGQSQWQISYFATGGMKNKTSSQEQLLREGHTKSGYHTPKHEKKKNIVKHTHLQNQLEICGAVILINIEFVGFISVRTCKRPSREVKKKNRK